MEYILEIISSPRVLKRMVSSGKACWAQSIPFKKDTSSCSRHIIILSDRNRILSSMPE